MGNLSAVAVREILAESAALEWHMTCNHYPPLPRTLIPIAARCIEEARKEDSDLTQEIELPNGITYRDRTSAPMGTCMTEWHLWDFVDPGDDVEDEFDDDDDSTEEYGDE